MRMANINILFMREWRKLGEEAWQLAANFFNTSNKKTMTNP